MLAIFPFFCQRHSFGWNYKSRNIPSQSSPGSDLVPSSHSLMPAKLQQLLKPNSVTSAGDKQVVAILLQPYQGLDAMLKCPA